MSIFLEKTSNGYAKDERGGVCIIISSTTLQCWKLDVLQKFQHPNAQARVVDHLGMATTILYRKKSAVFASHLEVGTLDIAIRQKRAMHRKKDSTN